VLDAADWYEQKREFLGTEFRIRFEEAVARIQDKPSLYATEEVSEARLCPFEQFSLYAIVYLILDAHLWVIAIANQR